LIISSGPALDISKFNLQNLVAFKKISYLTYNIVGSEKKREEKEELDVRSFENSQTNPFFVERWNTKMKRITAVILIFSLLLVAGQSPDDGEDIGSTGRFFKSLTMRIIDFIFNPISSILKNIPFIRRLKVLYSD